MCSMNGGTPATPPPDIERTAMILTDANLDEAARRLDELEAELDFTRKLGERPAA